MSRLHTSSESCDQENRIPKTKIQVGVAKLNHDSFKTSARPIINPDKDITSLTSSASTSQPPTSSSSTAIPINVIPSLPSSTKTSYFSPKTLYELCDSYFAKRNGRAKKRNNLAKVSAPNISGDVNSPAPATQKSPKQRRFSTNNTAPMVEIVDGKIVIKQSSLVANPTQNGAIYDDYEEVIEDNFPTATYASFVKRRPSPVWGQEETRLFYHALRQCGTEFTLMQSFFPNRTRKQLKAKYYREERLRPDLLTYALNTSLPLELAPFEAHLGKIPSGQLDDSEDIDDSNNHNRDSVAAIFNDLVSGVDEVGHTYSTYQPESNTATVATASSNALSNSSSSTSYIPNSSIAAANSGKNSVGVNTPRPSSLATSLLQSAILESTNQEVSTSQIAPVDSTLRFTRSSARKVRSRITSAVYSSSTASECTTRRHPGPNAENNEIEYRVEENRIIYDDDHNDGSEIAKKASKTDINKVIKSTTIQSRTTQVEVTTILTGIVESEFNTVGVGGFVDV